MGAVVSPLATNANRIKHRHSVGSVDSTVLQRRMGLSFEILVLSLSLSLAAVYLTSGTSELKNVLITNRNLI